jgi:hypothetical protein
MAGGAWWGCHRALAAGSAAKTLVVWMTWRGRLLMQALLSLTDSDDSLAQGVDRALVREYLDFSTIGVVTTLCTVYDSVTVSERSDFSSQPARRTSDSPRLVVGGGLPTVPFPIGKVEPLERTQAPYQKNYTY